MVLELSLAPQDLLFGYLGARVWQLKLSSAKASQSYLLESFAEVLLSCRDHLVESHVGLLRIEPDVIAVSSPKGASMGHT